MTFTPPVPPCGEERRRRGRYRIPESNAIPVDISLGETAGTMVDLSEDGVAVQTLTPLEPNRKRLLYWSFPGQAQRMLCVGTVVWSSGARAGIAFPEMPEFVRQCIRKWLEQQARAASGAEARVRQASATTRSPGILGPISKRIRERLDQE